MKKDGRKIEKRSYEAKGRDNLSKFWQRQKFNALYHKKKKKNGDILQ